MTLFELEVAQGTRLNKVTQLSQEIAAALRAKSVRIIAPIPGKATIGIEVPNDKRRMRAPVGADRQEAYDKKFARRCRCSSAWTPRAVRDRRGPGAHAAPA